MHGSSAPLLCAVLLVLSTPAARAQDLTGTWTDSAGRQGVTITQDDDRLVLRTGAGLEFTGTLTGDSLHLAYVYRTLDAVPRDYPAAIRPQLVGDSLRIAGHLEAGGSRIAATLYRHRYDRANDRLIPDRPVETAIVWTRILVLFVDRFGDTTDLVTSFSHPHPVVTLDDLDASAVRVDGGTAMLTLRGTVTDAIADIVADHAADITQVTVHWSQHGGGDTPSSVTVPVTGGATADTSAWRPYAFEGSFTAQVRVPVTPGSIEVAVEARNVIDNAGFDVVSFQVTEGRVTDLINYGSTGPGLVNPVRVVIADVSLPEEPGRNARVNGTPVPIVRRDGEAQLDRPLMALARPVPSGIPNLERIAPGGPTHITYRDADTDLHWAYIGHQGEPVVEGRLPTPADEVGPSMAPTWQAAGPDINYDKYPAGTEVTFDVYSTVFEQLRVRGAQDAEALRVQGGRQQRDSSYRVVAADRFPAFRGSDAFARVRVRLRGDAADVRQKVIRFRLHDRQTGREITTASVGRFEAVPLRTVIVAVDGLGYDAIRGLGTTYFGRAFAGSTNRSEYALSALPTITFTNWPGVFSGLPPARHGIQGNSFFAREVAGREPFASAGHGAALPNLGVVRGGFDLLGFLTRFEGLAGQARTLGSLYDNVARVTGRTLNAWSVHAFYAHAPRGRVRMADEYFGFDPNYIPHSPQTAALLDRRSAEDARARYRAHHDSVDVLTVYLPGPDNVAHHVGAVGTRLVNPTRPNPWRAGPQLPDVATPLYAIGQQVQFWTDSMLGQVVNAVDEFGYQYATLFVLVADHGLHAFRNDSLHNLFLPNRLDSLFTALGFDVWTGGGDIARRTLVYSPNGGMAHIYLRQTGRDWDDPPARADVMRVAGQLYIEALGGRSAEATARTRYPACTRPQDMATRRCHSGVGRLGPLRTPQDRPIAGEHGAFGDPPAIFVKVCDQPACDAPGAPSHLQSSFRWVRFVDPRQPFGGDVELRPIRDFIQARSRSASYPNFDWPEFEARMAEMNDTSWTGSRTGDIVVFTDARSGYLTVNDGDEFNGWHGGATAAESRIPLFFNIRGSVVNEQFLIDAVAAVRRANGNRRLRNWQLSAVLEEVYRGLRRP